MREFIESYSRVEPGYADTFFFGEISIFFENVSPKLAGLSLINFTSKDYFYSICWVPSQ